MTQLTVRGFDKELERRLRELARTMGVSLNKAALLLLRRGAGLEGQEIRTDVVGSSLDHLIGTWSDDEAEEFRKNVEAFERIDESLWQ